MESLPQPIMLRRCDTLVASPEGEIMYKNTRCSKCDAPNPTHFTYCEDCDNAQHAPSTSPPPGFMDVPIRIPRRKRRRTRPEVPYNPPYGMEWSWVTNLTRSTEGWALIPIIRHNSTTSSILARIEADAAAGRPLTAEQLAFAFRRK